MAELNHDIVNMQGQKVGETQLDPELFDAKMHERLVHAVVRYQLNKRRAGTHSTLTRSTIKGGGKKPYKQKGTGHARAGSNTSPLWVGGAVSFGPLPRKYDFKLPRKVRKAALVSVLTDKARNGQLVILDQLAIESGKTKDMKAVLEKLGLAQEKVTLLVPERESSPQDAGVWRSSRNLKNVITLAVSGVNVYDLLRSRVIISTKEAVAALQARIKGEGVTE